MSANIAARKMFGKSRRHFLEIEIVTTRQECSEKHRISSMLERGWYEGGSNANDFSNDIAFYPIAQWSFLK
ncbi:hypothetical protein NPIL_622681 [Nephila pilipes]|uniref:Uncharacterized protein n=1 Tax=Nephila pilipes TaxID=299642 RepID=A0A8X6N1L5_NEPPI|nr:hypothetical protein NPIL_622681 [Nephila pilipes]